MAAQCAAASTPACGPRGARVPYTRLWFCAPRAARPLMALAAAAWVGAMLAVMAAVSSSFLVPTVEFCAAFLHVPPALAGVTLLAVAGGAPDLATEVAAVLAAGPDAAPDDGALAAAVAVGTSLTVLAGGLAAAGFAARARGGAAFPSGLAAAREFVAYAVATIAVGATLWDGAVSVGEAAALLASYVAYVAVAVAVGRHGGPLSGATSTDVAAALRARGGVSDGADGLPAAPPSAFYGLEDVSVRPGDTPAVRTAGEVQLTAVTSSSRRRPATAAGDAPTPRASSPLAPPPTPRHAVSADGVAGTPLAALASGSSSARSSTASLLAGSGGGGAGAPTPAAVSGRGEGSHAGDAAARRSRSGTGGRRRRRGINVREVAASIAAAVGARLPRLEALSSAPRLRAALRVAAAPASLALHATIPCLAPDAPPFGPGAAAALALAAPALALEFLGAGPARVGLPAFLGASAAAAAALGLALAPRFIASRGAPVSPRTPLLAGLALAGAGAWLAASADEAVDALRAAARAVGAPAELASALLAWGGAIPELVAVAALARAGAAGATAALHSAAAGPVFNLLVALPLPAALAALRQGGGGSPFNRALHLTLTNGVIVLLGGTLLLLTMLAIALPACRWTVTPRFAVGVLAIYGAVQVAFLAVEGGVWKVPIAPSAKASRDAAATAAAAAAGAGQQHEEGGW